MRKLFVVLGLQVYACSLAYWQYLEGVQTDEAKYLLNIPYPHPPVGRFLLNLFEPFTHQELLWRVVLASLMAHAVWLIAKMVQGSTQKRICMCLFWLLSWAIVSQVGTVMMSVLTALQGLVLVYWYLQESRTVRPEYVALFWLVSLFTAYQIVLFGPIVLALLWKTMRSKWHALLACGAPVGLVILYIAGNPLAAASFVSAGGQNTAVPFGQLLHMVGTSWLTAGSVVLSILGTMGIFKQRDWPMLGSFILTALFLLTSFRPYYGILFVPLFIVGCIYMVNDLQKPMQLVVLQLIALCVFGAQHVSGLPIYSERATLQQIHASGKYESIAILGSFGHQWQYESTVPVRRYRDDGEDQVVVCVESCDLTDSGFTKMPNTVLLTWKKL